MNLWADVTGRRQRWADRQNARLRREYEASLRHWQSEADLNEHYHALALGARPLGPDQAPAGVGLGEDEEVYWAGSGAVLVECAEPVRMFRPVHAAYCPARRVGAYAPLYYDADASRDRGRVVVTDQRVLFIGGHVDRTWPFAALTGLVHSHRGAMTLMRVSHRQADSGLALDQRSGDEFRFFLALAMAAARGDRPGFVAHVAQLAARHLAERPTPPRQVSPRQAPAAATAAATWLTRSCFGPPGATTVRQAVPVLIMAMIALGAGVVLVPGSADGQASSPAAAARTPGPTTGVTAQGGPSPKRSPKRSPERSPEPARRPQPSTTPTRSPAWRSPSPSAVAADPVAYCEALENPWGYTFCEGEPITEPDAAFCDYFECVKNFWHGKGQVVQCEDGTFSKSGGRGGSCVQHGGEKRTLYQEG
ncbi:hypothetical protein CS0771_21390 [Catellatospora sp. IY07-71]|uniref:hypothetical protein n=1 Tax=Catellatospora sp. IY07-71 TaxID=2728827 RepID=UPI001BB367B4|nr:hypothetical protein [Catellatospora sp. IY07-71]BCJ72595.1 hypothetical protein CS0771_21390 [Catellatospora sp. IY07-71]